MCCVDRPVPQVPRGELSGPLKAGEEIRCNLGHFIVSVWVVRAICDAYEFTVAIECNIKL